MVRRALRWWFAPPFSPSVSFNVAIDFGAARAYLAQLRQQGVPATVHHLLVAAIGRVLAAHPEANARLVGKRVVRVDEVALAMPVNLVGHPSEALRETSLAFLRGIDRLSLSRIVERARTCVASERQGRASQPVLRALLRLGEHLPDPIFDGTLDLLAVGLDHPRLARAFHRLVPMSTALTNPGAAIPADDLRRSGMLFRGASLEVPSRPLHFSTLWGISTVQDEVVARDGVPEVRPLLPVVLVFDHRVFDGVVAGRLLTGLSALLQAPAAHFGARGEAGG